MSQFSIGITAIKHAVALGQWRIWPLGASSSYPVLQPGSPAPLPRPCHAKQFQPIFVLYNQSPFFQLWQNQGAAAASCPSKLHNKDQEEEEVEEAALEVKPTAQTKFSKDAPVKAP